MSMKADLVVRGGSVVTPTSTFAGGVAISNGKIVAVGDDRSLPAGREVIEAAGLHILPGIIDAHVHFRDPGLTHKEDFGTGSTAAACGGVTTVIDMPNVIPPTENAEQVQAKRRIAESKSLVDFGILGVVHQTNVGDILPMAEAGAIGYKIFFGETIGNLPSPDDAVCQEVFPTITKSGLVMSVHAESRALQSYWTEKSKAEKKNDPIFWEQSRPFICEAETIDHLIFFAELYDTKLHIAHTSTKQGVRLVARAKQRGLRVTAETCPHYLLREASEMARLGPLLKMNPPVRSRDHAEALWEGLLDGSVDMIATDHSPHTYEEKGTDRTGKLLKPTIYDCVSGFVGVETAVPLMLNEVNNGRMTLNQYVRLASENPARVWQMYPRKGSLRPGADGDLTIVDMQKVMTIDSTRLHSKNSPTPFDGWKVRGAPVYTIVRGNVQMRHGEPVGKPVGIMQSAIGLN